jgi:hypothetical protein
MQNEKLAVVNGRKGNDLSARFCSKILIAKFPLLIMQFAL